MRRRSLFSRLVTSLLARLLVVGIFLLVLRFGPWGNPLKLVAMFQADQTTRQQFEEVAEALESGRDPGGSDPINGYTGTPSSTLYQPPESSRERSTDKGFIAGLLRKIGFGDQQVRAPEWVPVFAGSIDEGTIRQRTREGEKTVICAAVPATGHSVASFYERSFTQMGYDFSRNENSRETTFNAESPDNTRAITVAIRARGAQCNLILTHLERPVSRDNRQTDYREEPPATAPSMTSR